MGNELNLGHCTNWVSHLNSVHRHAISHSVICKVHILVEERLEFGSLEEEFPSLILEAILPDDFFLADGWQRLIFWSIQLLGVFWPLAVREYIVVVFVGLIVAPVMSVSMRNRDVISLTWFALFSCLGALSLFSNCARFLNITALLMEFREVIKL